jgi:hypothetical protein
MRTTYYPQDDILEIRFSDKPISAGSEIMGASTTWRRFEMDILSFDSIEVLIECPGCKHQRVEKVGVLRKSPVVQWPKCKGAVTFDYRSLDEGLRGPERIIEALRRNIRLVYNSSTSCTRPLVCLYVGSKARDFGSKPMVLNGIRTRATAKAG